MLRLNGFDISCPPACARSAVHPLTLRSLSRIPVAWREHTQELQGRLWDAILAGTCPKVLDLLDQGAELTTSIGPEEWGKHPLHAAVANGHVELVKLLLNGQGLPGAQGQGQGSSGASGQQQQQQGQGQAAQQVPQPGLVQQQGMKPGMGPGRQRGSQQHLGDHQGQQPDHYVPAAVAQGQQEGGDRQAAGWAGAVGGSSACGSGDPGSVGVCGNGGCDPNQMDYASDPPLWHAVENNLVDLVGLLLAHGATAADLPPRDGRPKVCSRVVCGWPVGLLRGLALYCRRKGRVVGKHTPDDWIELMAQRCGTCMSGMPPRPL